MTPGGPDARTHFLSAAARRAPRSGTRSDASENVSLLSMAAMWGSTSGPVRGAEHDGVGHEKEGEEEDAGEEEERGARTAEARQGVQIPWPQVETGWRVGAGVEEEEEGV